MKINGSFRNFVENGYRTKDIYVLSQASINHSRKAFVNTYILFGIIYIFWETIFIN